MTFQYFAINVIEDFINVIGHRLVGEMHVFIIT